MGLSLLSSMARDCSRVKELLLWLVTCRRLRGNSNVTAGGTKLIQAAQTPLCWL